MKKLTGHSISEVRKRVRQYLIAEATIVEANEHTRHRGGTKVPDPAFPDNQLPVIESPDSALLRFKRSLDEAVAGDVFFLTYGIAEHAPLSDADREKLQASPDDLRFSTEIYDSMVDTLMGKKKIADDEINSMPEDERNVAETTRNSSSSLASSKRLLDLGLEKIRAIQEKRLNELNAIADRISGTSKVSPNLVDELKKYVVLLPEEVKYLRGLSKAALFDIGALKNEELKGLTDDQREQLVQKKIQQLKVRAFDNIRDRIGKGTLELTQEYIKSENELIGAAQSIAYGNRMHTLSVDQTGIPGTRKYKGDHVVPKELGASYTIKKALTGVGKSLKDGSHDVGEPYNPDSDVIDILIGGCVTLLTFKGPNFRITTGAAHGRLERSGLPMPTLQTIVALLLWEITYGSPRISSYMTNPETLGSFMLWAEHLDPVHTAEIARGFIGTGKLAYDATASGKSLRPGSRANSHWDSKTDTIISTARRIVPGVDPKLITPEQLNQIVSTLSNSGIDVTPDRVKKILSAREQVAVEKSVLANLSDTNNQREYEASKSSRKGSSPASLAKEVTSRVVSNESEKRIYKDVLRRMLFGVTLRCVGKSVETTINSDPKDLTPASLASASVTQLTTQRSFPIFEAKIERPKQSFIKLVQGTADRSKMVGGSSFLGLTDQKVSRGGGSPLETDSAKLGSAGEQTKGGKIRSEHKSEIFTPNMKINLTNDQINKAIENGTIGTLLSQDKSYTASKPFQIPFVEKVISRRENMTVEDVMALESPYDQRMKPLKVAVQLLGAKKFHDSANEKKAVKPSYLNPIPEMGIIPTGKAISENERVSDATVYRVQSQISQRAIALLKRESGIDVDPKTFQSFDLRDRIIRSASSGSLKSKLEKMITDLDRAIEAEGDLGVEQHQRQVKRHLLRFLHSSHGTNNDVLVSRINAQIVKNALASVKIKSNQILKDSISFPNVRQIKSSVASTSGGFGNLLSGAMISKPSGQFDTSSDGQTLYRQPSDTADAEAVDQALRLVSAGLYRESGSVDSSTSDAFPVPAASFAINAAKLKSADEDIGQRVLNMSSKYKTDPAANRGRFPSTIPLFAGMSVARQSAQHVINSFTALKIEEVLSYIIGSRISSDAGGSESEESVSENNLAELGDQINDLVEKTDELRNVDKNSAKALSDLITNKTVTSEDTLHTAKNLVSYLKDVAVSSSVLYEDLQIVVGEASSSSYHGTSQAEQEANETLKEIKRLKGILQNLEAGMNDVVKNIQGLDSAMGQIDISKAQKEIEQDLAVVASFVEGGDVNQLIENVTRLADNLIGNDSSKASLTELVTSNLINAVGSSKLGKSLNNIRHKTALKSTQNPDAVEKAARDKEEKAGLTPEQLILVQAIINKTDLRTLGEMMDPYEVAMRIIINTRNVGNNFIEIRNLRKALANAFFPFVGLIGADKLIEKGSGNSLKNLNYESTINARSGSITAALNSAFKLKQEASKGNEDAIKRLVELGKFLVESSITQAEVAPESTLVSQADARRLRTQNIATSEVPSSKLMPTNRESQDQYVATSAVPSGKLMPSKKAQEQSAVARLAAEKDRTPLIRSDATGDLNVQIGNIATYSSAAAKVNRVIEQGAKVMITSASGESIPLKDASLDDAIKSIERGDAIAEGANLKAIQDVLLTAQLVIKDLDERTGEDTDMSSLAVKAIYSYIMGDLKKLFPNVQK